MSKGAFLSIVSSNYFTLLLRILLGGILVFAAVGKLPSATQFVDVVSSYGLLPELLVRPYALLLPWVELGLGILLILGFLSRIAAGGSILMNISFIIANVSTLYKHSCCHCFGVQSVHTQTSTALIIDVVMILMALVIVYWGPGLYSIGQQVVHGKLRSRKWII